MGTADTFLDAKILVSVNTGKRQAGTGLLGLWFANFTLERDSEINDVIVNCVDVDNIQLNFSDTELTKLSQEAAILSFKSNWDEEDDQYWESYLND
ncbi:hypothetical protein QQ008_02330 [Fulvivirgaceae bacterium BMA10]|uniref:Uncharacterized protein n=1 Tax=Splendidivirga corallicola TaxID=3051826 RepID=A0ABT8KHI4_9BACT|nr:hypothetical protein [Fulvivirgaceae bacterium BMA10]